MRLFDTTYLIDLINEHPKAVAKAKKVDQEQSLNGISVITAHEYLFGVYRIYQPPQLEKSLQQAYKDLNHFHIFPLDLPTIKLSSEIHSELATEGKLIGINDIYIAATALQHRLTLTTRDRHFSHIPKLKLDFY